MCSVLKRSRNDSDRTGRGWCVGRWKSPKRGFHIASQWWTLPVDPRRHSIQPTDWYQTIVLGHLHHVSLKKHVYSNNAGVYCTTTHDVGLGSTLDGNSLPEGNTYWPRFRCSWILAAHEWVKHKWRDEGVTTNKYKGIYRFFFTNHLSHNLLKPAPVFILLAILLSQRSGGVYAGLVLPTAGDEY